MKIPNYKELGFNVKARLWNQNPNNFKEWQATNQKEFVKKLQDYLKKSNQYTAKNFKFLYQILFYYSFINFKKEQELITFFQQKGYTIKTTNLVFDAVFKVDLIATKEDKTLYVQVKNQPKNLAESDSHTLKIIAINQQATPILAYKKGRNWQFVNLLNNEKVSAF